MTIDQITSDQRINQEVALGLQVLNTARHRATQADFEAQRAQIEYLLVAQQLRPCYMTPIRVEHDGFRWICKAINIEGIVGAGDSPHEAMLNFDSVWTGLDRKRPDNLEAG